MKKNIQKLFIFPCVAALGGCFVETPELSTVPQTTELKHEREESIGDELKADKAKVQAQREEFLNNKKNELLNQE